MALVKGCIAQPDIIPTLADTKFAYLVELFDKFGEEIQEMVGPPFDQLEEVYFAPKGQLAPKRFRDFEITYDNREELVDQFPLSLGVVWIRHFCF